MTIYLSESPFLKIKKFLKVISKAYQKGLYMGSEVMNIQSTTEFLARG
jgi:hypothetical protein